MQSISVYNDSRVITLLKRDIRKNKKLIRYAGAVTENYPDGVR